MQEIFTRVSVRKWDTRAVEPEKIERILRATMAAPSARNQQPWEIYVVTDRATLLALSEATPYAMCVKNAPMAFVPVTRNEGLITPHYRHIDMAIATENLWLECEHLGLGAVMIGVAPMVENMENVRRILDLPPHLEPFTIVPCGYAAKRRPVQDRFDAARVHWVRGKSDETQAASKDAVAREA